MEISSAHHHHHRRQAMGSGHPLEEILLAGNCPKSAQQQDQKASRARPQPEQALKCPRCDSTNTKFCYYNNYSLSQPRYFCKGCRRYWTKGGSLRNVPVGGGCRKNKRSSSSSSSSNSSSSKNKSQEQAIVNSNPLLPTLPPLPPPALSYDPCSDLTLAFSMLHKHDNSFLLPNPNPNPNPNYPGHISTSGFLDILRSGLPTAGLVHNNPYCGLGGNGSVEEVVLPVDQGGYGDQGSCKALDGGESKGVIGHHQWQVGGDGSVGLETTRDYWNGVGSFWHGIINSSLM